MDVVEVNLNKLPKQNAQLIEALLKATGLEDIPNTFNMASDVGYCAYYDMVCHYIELNDGRKFGVDCDEDTWSDITLFCYKWTKEAIECSYPEFNKCHKIVEIIRIAVDEGVIPLHLLVETEIFNKEELKTAIVEAIKGLKVTFTDIESEIKKEGEIINVEVELSTNDTYINSVEVMLGNIKYILWGGNGYEELQVNIAIEGISIRTVVYFPKDLEGMEI